MDTKQIGEFLSALRKAKGMTQQAVADYLHISNKTVSKWERGDGLPELGSLMMLAELFDVTTDEILHGSRSKSPHLDLKQPSTNLLIKKQIRQFDTFALFAKLVMILGYIALLTIGYATYNSVIATGVALTLYLTGTTLLIIGVIKLQSIFDFIEEDHPSYNLLIYKKHHHIFVQCAMGIFLLFLSLPIFSTAQAHAIYSSRLYSQDIAIWGPLGSIVIILAYIVFRKRLAIKSIQPFLHSSKIIVLGIAIVMLVIPWGVHAIAPFTEEDTTTIQFNASEEEYDKLLSYRQFHYHLRDGGTYDIVTIDGEDYYQYFDSEESKVITLSVSEGERYLYYLRNVRAASYNAQFVRIEYYIPVPIPITTQYYLMVFILEDIVVLSLYGAWVMIKKK